MKLGAARLSEVVMLRAHGAGVHVPHVSQPQGTRSFEAAAARDLPGRSGHARVRPASGPRPFLCFLAPQRANYVEVLLR
eukprot:gene9883-biopygen10776